MGGINMMLEILTLEVKIQPSGTLELGYYTGIRSFYLWKYTNSSGKEFDLFSLRTESFTKVHDACDYFVENLLQEYI